MKKKFVSAFFLSVFMLSFPTFAQTEKRIENPSRMQKKMQQMQDMPPKEREAIMREMMQNAKKMRLCVNKAGGHDAINELKELSEAHRAQLEAMCTEGEQEKAQAYARDVSEEMVKDPRIVKLRECSEAALRNMPQFALWLEPGTPYKYTHICD